jgi:hypothetical protein
MKTKSIGMRFSLSGVVCAAAVFHLACSVAGQNLVVSTFNTGNIKEVTPGGRQITLVTGLDYPYGMAFDRQGDLFVANSADNAFGGSIIEITPGGKQITFATGVDPVAIVFDRAGNLYETDYGSGNIYKFTPDGTQSTFASGFSYPISMVFNKNGDLFVGSGYGDGNGSITEITPGGMQSTIASGLSFPIGLAFNRAGVLFEADNGTGNIYKIGRFGTRSFFASVLDPGQLVFDSVDDLFVAGYGGQNTITITEIKPNRVKRQLASLPGTPAGLVFSLPK